jgi:hypothetical protein
LDTIREMLHREPFVGFRIVVTGGDRYEIENPDLVALGESQLVYCFPRSDRFAVIRLNQIVSLEQHEPKSVA